MSVYTALGEDPRQFSAPMRWELSVTPDKELCASDLERCWHSHSGTKPQVSAKLEDKEKELQASANHQMQEGPLLAFCFEMGSLCRPVLVLTM